MTNVKCGHCGGPLPDWKIYLCEKCEKDIRFDLLNQERKENPETQGPSKPSS